MPPVSPECLKVAGNGFECALYSDMPLANYAGGYFILQQKRWLGQDGGSGAILGHEDVLCRPQGGVSVLGQSRASVLVFMSVQQELARMTLF